jgi:hypothetical protein
VEPEGADGGQTVGGEAKGAGGRRGGRTERRKSTNGFFSPLHTF